jgi:hypothetical protein
MKHKHALVIGGTGMLADVTLWLNKKGYFTTVIGRRNETYQRLMKKVEKSNQISSLLLDYHNSELLKEKVEEVVKQNGSFDLIVAWVHSSAPDAIPTILEVQEQNRLKKDFDFFHVKSSSSYFKQEELVVTNNCIYHEIFLGFKVVGNHSRWLTHNEISEGVKDTIHHKRPQTIVGQVEPWDLRPH